MYIYVCIVALYYTSKYYDVYYVGSAYYAMCYYVLCYYYVLYYGATIWYVYILPYMVYSRIVIVYYYV